eukprot:645903_1
MFGQPSGTSLFGASAAKPATSGGFGGFGNTQASTGSAFTGFGGASASTGSAFGSLAFGANKASTGTGLGAFGNAQSSAGSAFTGFGAKPTTGLGAFGSNTTANAGGLFGASTQNKTNTLGTFGGAATGTSLFGQASTGFAFGNKPATQSTFGGGMAGSTTSFGQPNQQNQVQSNNIASAERDLNRIMNSLNPQHPDNVFQCVVYNKVNPHDVDRYKRSQNASSELFEYNPDPKRLVPVQVTKYEDLITRLGTLGKASRSCRTAILKEKNDIGEVKNQHEICLEHITRFRAEESEDEYRLLKVVASWEKLRANHQQWTAEEAQFHQKLTGLQDKLRNESRFRGRLKELELKLKNCRSLALMNGASSEGEYSLAEMHKALSKQLEMVRAMEQQMNDDMRDLEIILRGFNEIDRRRASGGIRGSF